MTLSTYNEDIDLNVDWGGDASTGNKPVSGGSIQRLVRKELIESKEQVAQVNAAMSKKVGCFYYNPERNTYQVFADTESRDLYLSDPLNNSELLLGAFDAPAEYAAKIHLTTPTFNAVAAGSKGNAISFKFEVVTKDGDPTGDDVICTYTIVRSGVRQTIKERYTAAKGLEGVTFNADSYLGDGTTTIQVSISGINTLAATSVAITFMQVNLTISDTFDISQHFTPNSSLSVNYTVKGGSEAKMMEWYIDGEKLPERPEDEITSISTTRTKIIDLSPRMLAQGRHTLQYRAYIVVGGERFYSSLMYRDFIVYTSGYTPIIAVAAELPSSAPIQPVSQTPTLRGLSQFNRYEIRFAVYNPTGQSETEVTIKVNGVEQTVLKTVNGRDYSYSIIPSSAREDQTISFVIGTVEYILNLDVAATNTTLRDISEGLILDLNSNGRSNSAADYNKWNYKNVVSTLSGFNWNETSGWTPEGLLMNAGASLSVGLTPLNPDPVNNGITIELEFATTNVSNDDEVILDLTTNGRGLTLTASEVRMVSAAGKKVSSRFKSESQQRIAIVVNKRQGAVNSGLTMIYVNGILSGSVNYDMLDSYKSTRNIVFNATDNASVLIRHIRIYDTALEAEDILNNYILYRSDIGEMIETYNRNDICENGTQRILPDNLLGQLPVMVVTGHIPTLENTDNKNLPITVDVTFTDIQNPSRSFRMEKAVMTPQGTSSMGYPKKNFRLYTKKNADTILYDSEGMVVTDKLWAMRENSIPVSTWCLKADYAESSSTHNTGIARLWNDAMKNANVDGLGYALRTNAQKAAIENNYRKDVRTTIDGFPIVMFYHETENSPLIFMGKYNFNNDKSTEAVFGFRDIPGFDNSHVQCWEVTNNGNHLALFQDVNNFDTEWGNAFEARYPDKSKNVTDLKRLCQWVSSTKNNLSKFKSEKANYLDLPKVAAYYIYIMRFGAVDQTVKNTMLTSEDGEHWFFINYDNDTINGLRNDGMLMYPPTIDRQTPGNNDDLMDGEEASAFAYAGHDSVLWNNLEADDEFMELVRKVDKALYEAGMTYDETIRQFDTNQSSKWCERVYNQDAQYKYIGPYVNDNINNLFMLQGARRSHRQWWLSKRFSMLDARFVSGDYQSKVATFKVDDCRAGIEFSIAAGVAQDYGYGVNNTVKASGISLGRGESHTFTTVDRLFIGDPIRIYAGPCLEAIDLHNFIDQNLSQLDISGVYSQSLGTKLKSLILGVNIAADTRRNRSLSEISGLGNAQNLEVLDIGGYQRITSLPLDSLRYLKVLKAKGSGLYSVSPANGSLIETLELPASCAVMDLHGLSHLTLEGLSHESIGSVSRITIEDCPLIDTKAFITNWLDNKTVANSECSVVINGINWSDVPASFLLNFSHLGYVSFKGKVRLSEVPTEEEMELLKLVFGANCFSKSSAFYIAAPDSAFIVGPDSILEGTEKPIEPNFVATVFSEFLGQISLTVSDATGVHTEIRGLDDDPEKEAIWAAYGGPAIWVWADENSSANVRSIKITLAHVSTELVATRVEKTVIFPKRVYPNNSSSLSWQKTSLSPGDTNKCVLNVVSTGEINGNYTVNWSVIAPATGTNIASKINIVESTDTYCVVQCPTEVSEGDFRVQCELKYSYNNSVIFTKTAAMSIMDAETLMTSQTNPEAMAVCYAQGWCASPNKMTKTEALFVTDIGTAFKNAHLTHFEEFLWFKNVVAIGADAFTGNYFAEFYVPEQITSINLSAFDSYPSTGRLTTLYYNAIDCSLSGSGLVNSSRFCIIYIGEKVKKIPYGFVSCSRTNTTNITIYGTQNIEEIDRMGFDGCLLEYPDGFNSLRTIGDYAFQYLKNTEFHIPDTVTSIGKFIFDRSNIETVTLPNNDCTVEAFSFRCDKLKTVTIPENFKRFAFGMFGSSIETVYFNCIDCDIIEAPRTVGSTSTVWGLSAKPNVILGEKVQAIMSYMYAYCFIDTPTSFVVPPQIVKIGAHAFEGCSALTDITVGPNVTEVEDCTFYRCSQLNSAIYPNGISRLGKEAFVMCKLNSISLNQGITDIPQAALCYNNLTELELPNTITSLGSQAIQDNPITNLRLPINLQSTKELALAIPALQTLIVPISDVTNVEINVDTFGRSTTNCIGANTRDSGTNKLYVPVGAVGYETKFAKVLDPQYGNFTLVETDDFDNI